MQEQQAIHTQSRRRELYQSNSHTPVHAAKLSSAKFSTGTRLEPRGRLTQQTSIIIYISHTASEIGHLGDSTSFPGGLVQFQCMLCIAHMNTCVLAHRSRLETHSCLRASADVQFLRFLMICVRAQFPRFLQIFLSLTPESSIFRKRVLNLPAAIIFAFE